MNTYLNSIKSKDINSWNQDEINIRISESGFKFMVGKSGWRMKLGGTLTLYFLISYHYALLNLVKTPVGQDAGDALPRTRAAGFPRKA
jgi:hypothetical protein